MLLLASAHPREPEADVGEALHEADEGRWVATVVQPRAAVLHMHLRVPITQHVSPNKQFQHVNALDSARGGEHHNTERVTQALKGSTSCTTCRPDPMGGACSSTESRSAQIVDSKISRAGSTCETECPTWMKKVAHMSEDNNWPAATALQGGLEPRQLLIIDEHLMGAAEAESPFVVTRQVSQRGTVATEVPQCDPLQLLPTNGSMTIEARWHLPEFVGAEPHSRQPNAHCVAQLGRKVVPLPNDLWHTGSSRA